METSNVFLEEYQRTGVLNMPKLVAEYMASLGDDYQEKLSKISVRLGRKEQCILLCRLPLPARISGAQFVYKGFGRKEKHVHVLANEAHAMRHAEKWVTELQGYEHARIPKYYCGYTTYEPGEVPLQSPYICMEHIPGGTYVENYLANGCKGWTFREKRHFVRQMALFRLSMLSIRSTRIGGVTEDGPGLCVGAAIITQKVHYYKAPKDLPIPVKFYENLDHQPNEKSWTKQCIRRELAWWRDSLNEDTFQAWVAPSNPKYAWKQQVWLNHLYNMHIKPRLGRRYRQLEDELDAAMPFGFSHNDMRKGFNVQMDLGTRKIAAIIDWEMGMTVPYSTAVRDLFNVSFGIGDPDELIDEMPFEPDMYWDQNTYNIDCLRDWNEKTRARRQKRGIKQGKGIGSQMNANNFAAYGALRPQDLWYGDTLDEEGDNELEVEDDQDHFYFAGRHKFENGKVTPVLQPGTWYYEPVLHLMDTYLQNYGGVSKTCKWDDPYVSMWCQDSRTMTYPF